MIKINTTKKKNHIKFKNTKQHDLNTLFNINNMDNEKRYSNTFSMPPPPKPDPNPDLRWLDELQKIVWTPQLPPVCVGVSNNRNNLDFGQYQYLSDRANMATSFPLQNIMSNPNEFPHYADITTHGEPLKFNSSPFNYVMNERFIKRR